MSRFGPAGMIGTAPWRDALVADAVLEDEARAVGCRRGGRLRADGAHPCDRGARDGRESGGEYDERALGLGHGRCLLAKSWWIASPVAAYVQTRVSGANWRTHNDFRSTATGIRTRVSAVRGRRPRPLDDSGALAPFEASKAGAVSPRVSNGAQRFPGISCADLSQRQPHAQPRLLQVSGVHPPHVREEVLALVADGINDCEIARITGIPRATVRDWRRPRYKPERKVLIETCPRCWRASKPIRFTPEDYTELLGLYLGDGCISPGARTARLAHHAGQEIPHGSSRRREALLTRCFPANSAGITQEHGGCACVVVWVYSQHLACLFPQHGPGKKHERKIDLEHWQWALVERAPSRS